MTDSRFVCLNKNCSVKGDDERMISCWLCLGLCHFKCSGMKTLVAEALRNTKGLKWCCTVCRKIDVEFYRFYQSTRSTFASLQNKMSALSSEIAAYGNLFEDFKQLKSLQSPESSPKRRKSARNRIKSGNEPFMDQNLPVTASDTTNEPIETTVTVSVPSNEPVVTDRNSDNAATSSHEVTSVDTVATNCHAFSAEPGPSNSRIVDKVKNIMAPRQLVVIPPRRRIFISRLAFDTTVEDVEFYLKSQLGDDVDTYVSKFSYSQPRSITSFKIAVPAHIYDKVIHPDFWPENIFVREFIVKENQGLKNIARLPPSSKN